MQLYRSLIIFIIAIALASLSRIDAANAQVIPKSLQEGGSDAAIKQRKNAWTVGVAGGLIDGTYMRFADELGKVLDDGDNLRILPMVSYGAASNLDDLIYLRGVDLAVTQSDVFEYFRTERKTPNLQSRVQYILRLPIAELHILAKTDIRSLEDLRGKKVNFGPAGSGSSLTGTIVFQRLGVQVEQVLIDQQSALQKLQSGEVAALVRVVGKPVDFFARIPSTSGLHLVPIPFTKTFADYYTVGEFENKDYPSLVAEGQKVDTIAVPAVLAVFNWPRGSDRYRRIERFAERLFSKWDQFQIAPRHPKEPLINLRIMAHCGFDFEGDSMDGQLSFATLDYAGKKKRTKRDAFLAEMAAAVPWSVLEAVIAPHYPKEGPQGGRRAFPIAVMLRIYCLQQWYNLSDPGAEEALYDIQSMRAFCNLELGRDPIPDETTILNFRHLLEAHELTKTVFEAVAEYLEARGALLRGGTIVDATLIAASPSTKNEAGKRDPQMHSSKKGNQWYFGMKAHVGVDAISGLVHTAGVTSGNVHDAKLMDRLIRDDDTAVYGDKGYASGAKKRAAEAAGVLWAVKEKAKPGGRLTARQRARNHRFGKVRAKVEHVFRVVKCQFGYRKVRYRGIAKNGAQVFSLLALANLYLARRTLPSA